MSESKANTVTVLLLPFLVLLFHSIFIGTSLVFQRDTEEYMSIVGMFAASIFAAMMGGLPLTGAARKIAFAVALAMVAAVVATIADVSPPPLKPLLFTVAFVVAWYSLVPLGMVAITYPLPMGYFLTLLAYVAAIGVGFYLYSYIGLTAYAIVAAADIFFGARFFTGRPLLPG